MIKDVQKPQVDGFTYAYASTYIKPTETEIALVKANLKGIVAKSPNSVIKNNGVVECNCINEDEDEWENYYLYIWHVGIPYEFSPLDPEDEEREISIIQCSNCGKWALCD